MRLVKVGNVILFYLFFLFSLWLMGKSFGFDPRTGGYWVARNEVGDFGLHIGLIRSFSQGNNFPPESPFFFGMPLAYHFGFDLLTGFFVKFGMRMDLVCNVLSALGFAGILFLLFRLSGQLFGMRSWFIHLLAPMLFVFHGGVTAIDFLVQSWGKGNILALLWYLPDYLHKGPFDGSTVSILLNLNVFLNQRHLIVGLFFQLAILSFLVSRFTKPVWTDRWRLLAWGALFGITVYIHLLLFVSSCIVFGLLFMLYKQLRKAVVFFFPAFLVALPHIVTMIAGQHVVGHPYFVPGFFSHTVTGWLWYWIANVGVGVLLIPLGFLSAPKRAKPLFVATLSLFIIPNLFQLSFRLEHNHSMFNYFFAIASLYAAYAIVSIGKKGVVGVMLAIVLFVASTASGLVDLAAIKNDFRYPVFQLIDPHVISWIEDQTSPHSVFLAPQRLYDPVVLAGRLSYVGHPYYVTVMGYPNDVRLRELQKAIEHPTSERISMLRTKGVHYLLLPKKQTEEFPYTVDTVYFDEHATKVFDGVNDTIYQL